MQCRNCRCYLDDEFRYCPRCGAPNSLAWPVAGAPWLRRPAAVLGLALLLIGWLVALQRQLWLPGGGSRGTLARSATRIAARPAEAEPVAIPSLAENPRPRTPAKRPSPDHRLPAVLGSGSPRRPLAAQSGLPVKPRVVAPRTVTSRHARSEPRLESHRKSLGAATSGSARPRRLLATLPSAASSPFTARRPIVRNRLHRPAPARPRHVRDPWSAPPVLVGSHGPGSARPQLVASNLTVSISARPYGVKTWVYMDGGKRLGAAPLRVRFDRPGRHKFFLFAPDLGLSGRAYRTVEVTGRSRQWISATMGSSREMARLSNL